MKIYGLQKMTLLDYPGHVGCTVFTGGCDFRCPFCHNYELACASIPPVMEEEELFSFLEKRRGLLDAVTITGGEPCLNVSLPGLIRKIRDMGFLVKLDTNGYHPDMLRAFVEEGNVDYVAMDIKNSPEKYAVTAGVPSVDLERIKESIRILLDGSVSYEFRTTVVKELHEAGDFDGIGEMIRGADQYYLQIFTDRDTVPYAQLHAPEKEELASFLAVVQRYVPSAQIRGEDR